MFLRTQSVRDKGARPSSHIGFRRSLSERDVNERDLSTLLSLGRDSSAGSFVGPEGGVASVIKAVTVSAAGNWLSSSPLDSPTAIDGGGDGKSKSGESSSTSSQCNENRAPGGRKEHHRSSSQGTPTGLKFAKQHFPSMRDLARGSKVKSLMLSESGKSKSLPKDSSPWSQIGAKMEIIYENTLYFVKVQSGEKKRSWKQSRPAWAVLTPNHLSFFKYEDDGRSKSVKPDIVVDLLFCRIEETKILPNRPNAFILSKVGTRDQFHCWSESEELAKKWYEQIYSTVKAAMNLSGETITHRYRGDTALIGDDATLVRKRSGKKLMITNVEPKESEQNIRAHLRQLLTRRPRRQDLVDRGIVVERAVFGRTVEELAEREGTSVPVFMERCLAIIEGSEENLKTDGIYRASGNLSLIQRIRVQVDQNNLGVLEQEGDIHVLAGALKLFLREMREPLIPTHMFQNFLRAVQLHGEERRKEYKALIVSLPKPNYATVKRLFEHLRKVSQYSEFNRMQISNLAIVFGPTVMWNSDPTASMATDLMQQNLIVENLLTDFEDIFVDGPEDG